MTHQDQARRMAEEVELPEPALFAHELIKNRGGVWLGVKKRGICERAHVEGETSEKIYEYYTEAQVHEAIAAALVKLTEGQEPVAETYTGHFGNRMGNRGFVDVRPLLPENKLPTPGTKLYAHPIPSQQEERVRERDEADHNLHLFLSHFEYANDAMSVRQVLDNWKTDKQQIKDHGHVLRDYWNLAARNKEQGK